jgi:hypothetical protein
MLTSRQERRDSGPQLDNLWSGMGFDLCQTPTGTVYLTKQFMEFIFVARGASAGAGGVPDLDGTFKVQFSPRASLRLCPEIRIVNGSELAETVQDWHLSLCGSTLGA